MMRGLHLRLSYANVVSTVCLFLLLGGSSYAAVKVGTRDLRNDSVTTAKIKNGTIQTRDVSRATRRELRGAQGRQGRSRRERRSRPAR